MFLQRTCVECFVNAKYRLYESARNASCWRTRLHGCPHGVEVAAKVERDVISSLRATVESQWRTIRALEEGPAAVTAAQAVCCACAPPGELEVSLPTILRSDFWHVEEVSSMRRVASPGPSTRRHASGSISGTSLSTGPLGRRA